MSGRPLKFRIHGMEVELEVSTTSDASEVRLDGVHTLVRAEPLADHLYRVFIGGEGHLVRYVRHGDARFIQVDGEAFQIDVIEDGAAAAAGESGAAGGELRSPMPGKVVKVMVRAGDMVEVNQVLVIVEAMKMENEVRAPGAGRVKAVHVEQGAPVDGGQLLVELAPAEKDSP
ncbi:MAG: hypothetical protein GMKNLPBB_02759 [Myxococcota bacterium]|nr:hypothetical protein [Myxococcota bacterium]